MPELEFTESELEAVTMVFKQYETGLREACIDVKAGPDTYFLINEPTKIKSILLKGFAAGPGEPRPEHDGAGGD